VAVYVAASTCGGAITGAILAGLGTLVSAARPDSVTALRVVVGAVVAAAVFAEFCSGIPRALERRWRVPERWLHWSSKERMAAAYGVLLGLGVLTQLRRPTAFAAAAVLLLAPTPAVGAAVGAAYGLTRGLTLGAAWLRDRTGIRGGAALVHIPPRLTAGVLAGAAIVAYTSIALSV
jgi:hypothetical protein